MMHHFCFSTLAAKQVNGLSVPGMNHLNGLSAIGLTLYIVHSSDFTTGIDGPFMRFATSVNETKQSVTIDFQVSKAWLFVCF